MEIKFNRGNIYKQKVTNMARVISEIGYDVTNRPPTIIGICEVENRNVVEDLIANEKLSKYNYGIVHYDSPDRRGIDVGLLYNKDIFKVINSNSQNVEKYKNGKDKLFGFFIGEAMKLSKGKANPKILNDLFKKKLSQ